MLSTAAELADQNGIASILSDDDLQKLRLCYDRTKMIAAANAATVGAYPEARGLIEFLSAHFFDPQTTQWEPRYREGAIVALLTVHSQGDGLLLVVHFYWGLMEGLSVGNLCELLLLTGIYTGLPNFTEGVGNLKTMILKLQELLKQAAETHNPSLLDSVSVIGELRKIFS